MDSARAERSGVGRGDPRLCHCTHSASWRLPLLCAEGAATAATERTIAAAAAGVAVVALTIALRRLRLERSSEGDCSSGRPLPLLCCSPSAACHPLAECRCRCLGWDAERWSERSSDSSAWNTSRCPRQAMGCTERSRGAGGAIRASGAALRNIFSHSRSCLSFVCALQCCSSIATHWLATGSLPSSASRFTRSSLAAPPLLPFPSERQGCLFDCVPGSKGQRRQQERWRRACSRAASHCRFASRQLIFDHARSARGGLCPSHACSLFSCLPAVPVRFCLCHVRSSSFLPSFLPSFLV